MRVLLVLSLLMSTSAWARTQVIFGKDKASVLLFGAPGDPDGVKFWDILNVPVVEQNGKLTKTLSINGADGVRVINIACAFSKVLRENGSCFLVFFNVPGVVINSSGGEISYTVTEAEAARLAEFFIGEQDLIYSSADQRFQISITRDAASVHSISLRYH